MGSSGKHLLMGSGSAITRHPTTDERSIRQCSYLATKVQIYAFGMYEQ